MKNMCLWFTGLSGSGKTTLANMTAKTLTLDFGRDVEVLDGDNVRANLTKDLGFSKADRDTNVERIGYVAYLLARHGVVPIVAAISPYNEAKRKVRHLMESNGVEFVEIYCACDLDVLIERDPKGLYKKAIAGEIENFTGVSDPFEEPAEHEIAVYTDRQTPSESAAWIRNRLEAAELI